SYDSEVVNQNLVLRLKFSGENRHLRQAANRWQQPYTTRCEGCSILTFIQLKKSSSDFQTGGNSAFALTHFHFDFPSGVFISTQSDIFLRPLSEPHQPLFFHPVAIILAA